jgi:hypothetical protein
MLRLSEAIRLGAAMHPQITGAYFRRDLFGETIGSCALGAALYAVGTKDRNYFYKHWPWAVRPTYGGANPSIDSRVVDGIAHRNDRLHWSREKIADWVEEYEKAHDVYAQPIEIVALEEKMEEVSC